MRLWCFPIVFAALAACASTRPAVTVDETDPSWPGPPPEASGTLAEDEITEACAAARLELNCQVTTSAEGDHFSSCECSAFGNAVGQGRLTVTGSAEGGGTVDADFELTDGDNGWELGKLLENRGIGID